MKRFIAASLLIVAVGVFSPFAFAGGGGNSPGVSSGEIYSTIVSEALAYDPYGEGFYLSLELYPKYLPDQPSKWTAVVCKSGPGENGRIESVPFKHDITWSLMQEKTEVTQNFFVNSGEYCTFQEVDLSFIPCDTAAYVRARVTPVADCSLPAGCDSDTGVIPVYHSCGGGGGI